MGTVYNKYSFSNTPQNIGYRYIVIHISAIRVNSDAFMQIDQIVFTDNNGNRFEFPQYTIVEANISTLSGGEAENLIDPNINNEMVGYWSSNTGCYVRITLPESSPLDIKKYCNFSWYTGHNSNSNYNPVSWEVSVSNDALGVEGIIVNKETNYNTPTTPKTLAYTGTLSIPEPVPSKTYKYLIFNIMGIKSGKTSGMMQFNELSFTTCFGTFGNFVYSSDVGAAISGVTAYWPVTNIVDNDILSILQTSWSGGAVITIILPDDNLLDVSIYSRWSWYTGNDATERDPASWALFGANQSNLSDAVLLSSAANIYVTDTRHTLAYHTTLLT